MANTKIAKVRVSRGLEANLPFGYEEGRLYLTKDTHKLFAGQGLSLPLVQVGVALGGLTVRGAWVISTAYDAGDVVTYSGLVYLALQDSTGAQPDTSPTDWDAVTFPEQKVRKV